MVRRERMVYAEGDIRLWEKLDPCRNQEWRATVVNTCTQHHQDVEELRRGAVQPRNRERSKGCRLLLRYSRRSPPCVEATGPPAREGNRGHVLHELHASQLVACLRRHKTPGRRPTLGRSRLSTQSVAIL